MTQAITAENLVELRRQAEDVLNINHAIPGARSTGGMPDDVVEALNAAGDRYGPTDWESSSPERERVMLQVCAMLPTLGLVPLNHDPATGDWHWSSVRCILAGAGYEAHAALATVLQDVYPQCTLLPDETFAEWMKALREAHQQSGIPCCLAALPWKVFKSLPEIASDSMNDMDTRWATAAALIHVLKHTRTTGDEVRVCYKGRAIYCRRDTSTNLVKDQLRVCAAMLSALGMGRIDGRAKYHALSDIGTTFLLPSLVFMGLLPALPLSSVPGNIIVGQFTALVASPDDEGWFQHGLRLTRAWSANGGSTRVFTGTDETVLGYAWRLEASETDQEIAFNRLAKSVPKTYEVASPSEILRAYQPNFMLDWVEDLAAHDSIFDAIIIMSVMRDRVLGAREEFPIVWLLPDEPTAKGSTNQGKTAASRAIAGSMTPGIRAVRPPDSTSAPDMRVVGGMIKSEGTLCLEEWAMPKNQAHPLSARNLQVLATGNDVPLGEVLENNPTPVRLRQPLVASAKCVALPEDVRNRSFFLFLRCLTAEERADVNRFQAIIGGEVALRMRLAALSLAQEFKLHELEPVASEAFRFTHHVALAMRLYELRTGRAGPAALAPITRTMQAMERRLNKHVTASDESGLQAEMDTGESIVVRASDLFATLIPTELHVLRDILLQQGDAGKVTAGALLRARAATDANAKTIRGLLQSITGSLPRANDRALGKALGRDLQHRMAEVGTTWPLPESLGLDGWRLRRVDDLNGALRVTLECVHPGRTSG